MQKKNGRDVFFCIKIERKRERILTVRASVYPGNIFAMAKPRIFSITVSVKNVIECSFLSI